MPVDPIAILQEIFATPKPKVQSSNGLPAVPVPPMFEPPIKVSGNPTLARAVHDLEGKIPSLKSHVREVTTEPALESQDNFADLLGDKSVTTWGSFNPRSSWIDSIYGIAPKAKNERVHINPGVAVTPIDMLKTIGHEIGHSAGQGHPSEFSSDPTNTSHIEELIDQAYPDKVLKQFKWY